MLHSPVKGCPWRTGVRAALRVSYSCDTDTWRKPLCRHTVHSVNPATASTFTVWSEGVGIGGEQLGPSPAMDGPRETRGPDLSPSPVIWKPVSCPTKQDW